MGLNTGKLLIDLDVCWHCCDCGVLCSYIQHPSNNGMMSLLEFAHFAIQCRRCEDSPCVTSCPWEALEFQKNNMLKRYTMRCTSCKSCSRACPFGVIYPETIPFITAKCDFCIGRLPEGKSPSCLEKCTDGSLKFGEFQEEAKQGLYRISEHLFVKTSYKWQSRGEEIPQKKRL